MASRNTRHQRNQKRRNKRRLLQSVYQWHRIIGLTAGFFAVWLAITGILLNHTPRLGLDTRLVENSALLSWYGIDLNASLIDVYGRNDNQAFAYQNTAVISEQSITLDSAIHSLSANDDFWLATTTNSVSLITSQGELIETSSAVPHHATDALITPDNQIYLRSGDQTYCGNIDFANWEKCSETVAISKASKPMTARIAALAKLHSISWERILQDAHSGRLFGLWGTAMADICGVLIILLAFSGTYTWFARRRHRRK